MKRREESTLKLRERIKSRKPNFRRQETWRYKRLSGRKEKWRKAKGIDSKMRLGKKGWPKSPKIGYRGPKKVRNLHPSGYEEILIFNVDDLDNVDPKRHAVRIAHGVGAKKRVEITIRSEERGLHVLNPRTIIEAEEAAVEEAEEKKQGIETEEAEEIEVLEKGEKKT